MTIPPELAHILSADPEVMWGAVCFTDTRIPVVMLLDNVAAGIPMERFYAKYPDLTPELVDPVLDWQNRVAHEALGLEFVPL
jgi:uncharacterized protein (DUF433 family)